MIKTASQKKPNLWDRWVKKEVIPHEVLINIWDYGIKFCVPPPSHGLKMATFLELLWNHYKSLPEGKCRDAALHLFIDTVESELTPYWKDKIKSKNFRK